LGGGLPRRDGRCGRLARSDRRGLLGYRLPPCRLLGSPLLDLALALGALRKFLLLLALLALLLALLAARAP